MKRKYDGGEASAKVDASGIASLLPNPSGKQNAPATSIKPSRLAPSVPMHMKTRGSQKALSIMSGSASGDSRHSSIGLSANGVGQSGDDIDQPTKRQRISRESSAKRSSHSPDSSDSKASISETPKLATFITATENISSAKRKHTDAEGGDQDQQPVDAANAAAAQHDKTINDQVPVAPPKKRLGRPPKKQKITPAISDSGAPPVAKRPPGRPPRLGRLPLNRQATEKVVHRIPGRRRKPNPDAELDADLGRLAELRRNYRMLAKIVKPAIAELAERAITDIENDPEAHKQSPRYQLVQDELDARFNQRIAQVEREYKLKVAYEKKMMAIEEECIKMNFERKIRELQEKYIIDSKHEVIENIRAIDTTEDNEATEDESELDDEPETPRSLLRDTSRSVFPIETEKKWKALEARGRVAKLLEVYAPNLVEDMKRHELNSYQSEGRSNIELENIRKLTSATTVVNATTCANTIGVSAMDALAELSTKLLEIDAPVSARGKLVLPVPNGESLPGAKLQVSGEHSAAPEGLEVGTPRKDISQSNATAEAALKPTAKPLDIPYTSPTARRLEYGSFGNFEDVRSSAEMVKATPTPKDMQKARKHEGEFAERRIWHEQGQGAEISSITAIGMSQQGSVTSRYGSSVTSPLRTSRPTNSDGGFPAINAPAQPATGSLEGFREGPILMNYARAVQPHRQSGLAPLHTSPRSLNMDSAMGSPTRGTLGQGKQAAVALSPIARSTGKAQPVPGSGIPPIAPYVSPYGPMNEQARSHNAATVQVMPVPQQLARPNLVHGIGSAQILSSQAPQLQQAPPARRRELRPAPNPAMPPPIYSRYPHENYYSTPVYGYPEAEASPLGRVPEGFYGYAAPFDPTGGQGYYPNGPYLHPTLQPLQYPYLMYNPPAAQPVPPSQPGQHQQAPAPLQPAFAGQLRIAPNHTAHGTLVPPPPPPPPQRPLTFQYYQPPAGNQPGPPQNEQPRR